MYYLLQDVVSIVLNMKDCYHCFSSSRNVLKLMYQSCAIHNAVLNHLFTVLYDIDED